MFVCFQYYKPWLETTKIISSIKKKRKLEVEVFQWLRGDSDGQMLLETLKASFSVSENMYTKLNEEVVNMKLPIYEKEVSVCVCVCVLSLIHI